MTPLWVEHEHQIGKFNYHSDRADSKKKPNPDSVYVMKLLRDGDDFDKKYGRIIFDHTAQRVPLAEKIQSKWKSTKLYEEFGKTIEIKKEVLDARKRRYNSDDGEWEQEM